MANKEKIFADPKFVGVWKVTTKVKDILLNNAKLNFPEQSTRIISISNTQGGTIMYIGQPSPDAKGFPATRASGIGVEFHFVGHNDKYMLNELLKMNIVDNANLLGESTQEWSIPGKGIVAKIITRSEYHRVGRMRTS